MKNKEMHTGLLLSACEVLSAGDRALASAGVENHRQEAIMLLAEASGRPEKSFFLEDDRISEPEEEIFFWYVDRRTKGEPLQYILGYAWFYGYRFKVNDSVLIPRFDTENLVEKALKMTDDIKRVKALDLCAGSGAIGLAYGAERAKKNLYTELMLLDISPAALFTAQQNAVDIFPEAVFLESDLFRELGETRFDIILSNPPYVTAEEMTCLTSEVREHEPHLALYGGADGLDFYRRIIRESRQFLNPDGILILEIGCSQGKAVESLMAENGFAEIMTYKDLAGLDRVVTGRNIVRQ